MARGQKMRLDIAASPVASEAPPGPALPGLDALWAQTLGDPRICIAVLDGPADLSHPSLAGAKLSRVQSLISDPAGQGPMSCTGRT